MRLPDIRLLLEEHVNRIAEDVLEPMVDFSPDEVKFMESIANSYKILRRKLNNHDR